MRLDGMGGKRIASWTSGILFTEMYISEGNFPGKKSRFEEKKMTDPESREPILKPEQAEPLFAYQIQYPLGVMSGALARNMAELIDYLNAKGIEPFSVTRVGPVI